MFADIQPADVYALCVENQAKILAGQERILSALNALFWVIALSVASMWVKMLWNATILWRFLKTGRRVDIMCDLMQKNGTDTDRKAAEMAASVAPLVDAVPVAAAALEAVAQDVKRLPVEVGKVIEDKAGGGSGVGLGGSKNPK